MKTSLPKEARAKWIDNARGFIIFNTALSMFMPGELRRAASFLMLHSEGRSSNYVTYFDMGLCGFIVIMGIMLPASYARRVAKDGILKARAHLATRYILLAGLGFAYSMIQLDKPLIVVRDGIEQWVGAIPVISWGTFETLGAVGLVTLPLLKLSPLARAIVALCSLCFYQLMLQHGGWSDYAFYSKSGGLLGSVFGFSVWMIFGTIIGEALQPSQLKPTTPAIKNLLISFIVCAIIGWLLAEYLWIYPNNRLVTAGFIIAGLSAASIFLIIFMIFELKFGVAIPIVSSFGKNTLLTFFLIVQLRWFVYSFLDLNPTLLLFCLGFPLFCAFIYYLDKRQIIIKL